MNALENIFELEKTGQVSQSKQELVTVLEHFLNQKNAQKIQEILELIKDRKIYKSINLFYQVHSEIILGILNEETFLKFRNSSLEFKNEKQSIDNYNKKLIEIFKSHAANLELVKNEILLLKFFEKILLHDEIIQKSLNKEKVHKFEFKNNWLIKQLALYSKCPYLLNYACLALIHHKDLVSAKKLYHYALSKNILISTRLKKYVSQYSWEVENQFRNEPIDDKTQVFEQIQNKIDIDQLLQSSESPFISKTQKLEIINTYQPRNDQSQKNIENIDEQKRQMIISFGPEDIPSRINFYIENEFYDEAVRLIDEQIDDASGDHLNWYYLRLFALLSKKDYNNAIEFSDNHEHHWKLEGIKAVDLWYLSAEAHYFLGHLDRAKEYYGKIAKLSPDYRLTKVRLEEINAHK